MQVCSPSLQLATGGEPREIEIRFCPASAVQNYPLETRRDLQSVLLQNAAVINHGTAIFKIDEIVIELLQSNRTIESRNFDREGIQRIGERTEPHLHLQICDNLDPLMCAGIPVNFSNVTIE